MNLREAVPTALYGFVLLMTALAWSIMQILLLQQDDEGILRQTVGGDLKGKASPVMYLAGIACAFFAPWVSDLLCGRRRDVANSPLTRGAYHRGTRDPPSPSGGTLRFTQRRPALNDCSA